MQKPAQLIPAKNQIEAGEQKSHMYYVHTYIYVHIVFVLENHVKFSLLLC